MTGPLRWMEISVFLTQIASPPSYRGSAVASHAVTEREVAELKGASLLWWRRKTSFSPLWFQSKSMFASIHLLLSLHLLYLLPCKCRGSEAVHQANTLLLACWVHQTSLLQILHQSSSIIFRFLSLTYHHDICRDNLLGKPDQSTGFSLPPTRGHKHI